MANLQETPQKGTYLIIILYDVVSPSTDPKVDHVIAKFLYRRIYELFLQDEVCKPILTRSQKHQVLVWTYGTAIMQVYIRVRALDALLVREPSIAFRVLVKHVCLLTTYSQVISITCEWNHSIHCFLESTSRVKCESCMQANLVKSISCILLL